jgi:3-dehydroquinate synthase
MPFTGRTNIAVISSFHTMQSDLPSFISSLMPSIQTVLIDLADRSYPIEIGAALLGSADIYVGLPAAAAALIVTNTTVAPLYAQMPCKHGPGAASTHRCIWLSFQTAKNTKTGQP